MSENNYKKIANENEMTFFDHLEELRWNLFRAAIAIFVGAVAAFFFKDFIFNTILLSPKNPDFVTNKILCDLAVKLDKSILCINQNPVDIINLKITGQFVIHITISLIAGVLIAFPYVIFEIWRFIKPALYQEEKKSSRMIVFFVSLLFFLGVLLGYYIIVPVSLNFLSNYSVSEFVNNQISLNSYISTISMICFAAGIIFELPVFTFFLTKAGLVTPQFMKSYRKHAVVVILILSSIITPPDVMSQLLIAIPLYILYEISIGISKRVMVRADRKRDK